MRKLIASWLVLLCATAVAMAEDIDLGVLSPDTDYELEDFKTYKATYTAEQTGVLTVSSTTTDELKAYSNAAGTKAVAVTKNKKYGAHDYDMAVEAGTTYYFFSDFIMNSHTTVRIAWQETIEAEFVDASPALGSVFNVSDGGQISLNFNKAVSFTGATITLGASTQNLSGAVSDNSIFFNDTKTVVWNALQAGSLQPGDKFTITLEGVALVFDKTKLYHGDGKFEAEYVVGKMPLTLIQEQNTSNPFLSYYTEHNEEGIVKLTFSGEVNAKALSAVIKYGEVDLDAEGGYYVEYLQPTLSEDRRTVMVNLQGKRRKAQDMVTSGTLYDKVLVGVLGVMDDEGNYAFASGSGSLGSYWFTKPFKEVTANVAAEFSPANGADITAETKGFEIWIADEEKLTYDGILFSYEKNGAAHQCLVAHADIHNEQDPEDATARILTFAVPAELIGAENILLSFKNLQCADGSDYSHVLRAKYNALVISRANPVAGATLEFLNKGQEVKIYTNKTSVVERLDVSLTDLNPGEADRAALFAVTAHKSAGGNYFTFVVPETYRLESNHDYQLEATAEGFGSDYILYHGAATPFRYSDVLLESVTPDTTSVLSGMEDVEIALTYDGLVKVVVDGKEATPVGPDEEGYANVWKYTVTKETIAQAGASLSLEVLATDLTGYRVQGNSGYKDYNVLLLRYATQSTAIERVNETASTPDCHAKLAPCYNLQGQRIATPSHGMYVARRKVFVR